ncbi:hypothetical protein Agub_g1481, partial [Astrephomene gubernaculifera]
MLGCLTGNSRTDTRRGSSVSTMRCWQLVENRLPLVTLVAVASLVVAAASLRVLVTDQGAGLSPGGKAVWGQPRTQQQQRDHHADWRPAVPYGIAHRGASAELPEHTREAYEAAVAEGADFIECDVVLTADLVPLCRHEPNLEGSTDAAAKFPHRRTSYLIDGVNVSGIFSVDLTAAEVATLRAVQPWPFRNQSYNGQFRVATLADFLDVAKSAPRPVGIYPETKHPSWTNSLPALRAAATRLEDILLAALHEAGFGAGGPYGSEAWRQRPVFVQSFEASSLRYMAQRTCAPMVLLLGEWEGWSAPDSGLTLAQLTEDTSLAHIAGWAAAVGPDKETLVTWEQEQGSGGGSGGGGGNGSGSGRGRYVSSGLVEKFHAHGLQVHPYTLRPEPRFFLPHLADHYYRHHHTTSPPTPTSASSSPPSDPGPPPVNANVSLEYQLLLADVVMADAVFADHMPSFVSWRQQQQQHGHGRQQQMGWVQGTKHAGRVRWW